MARIFETNVTLDETQNGMRVLIEFNTDIFTKEAMTRFLYDYAAALAGAPRIPQPIIADREDSIEQSLVESIKQQVCSI